MKLLTSADLCPNLWPHASSASALHDALGYAGLAICNDGMVVDDGVCKPDCGKNGEVCCAGNKCGRGLECDGGKCKPDCGEDGEACCAGNKCEKGLECSGGKCKPDCGKADEVCCAGNKCDRGLECEGGKCKLECGASGDKPCPSFGQCGKWLSNTSISSKPFMEIKIKDKHW